MPPTEKTEGVPVYPGEKVLRSEPTVAHMRAGGRGGSALQGVLHLTDQRLIFRANGEPTAGGPGYFPFGRIVATAVFAPKLLGFLPTSRRALRVSADFHFKGQETWFVLADADGWNTAVTQARSDAATKRLDLGRLLSAAEAEPQTISREACGDFLAHDRGFPAGFWHPDDEVACLDVMGGALKNLGAPDVLSDPTFRAELQRAVKLHPPDDEGEDKARRHQIALVAARVNAAAGPAASTRRLYQFAEDIPGWDAEEPVWLYLTADERARLLALGIVHPQAAGGSQGG
jgi:hypothetical protein